MGPPGESVLPGAQKAKAVARKKRRPFAGVNRRSGDRGGFLFEGELDLLVLADVDGDLAAVLQPAEEQLVADRPADGVLDQARPRTRAHQRVEAFLRQVRLQRVREARLDLRL